jgi:hypothetical protein
MRRLGTLLGIALCACGRLGFDVSPALGNDGAPIDTAPIDAAIPLALDPGFPIVVNANATGGLTVSSAPFSTPGPDRLLVAVFVWGTGGTDEQPLSITGGQLTWTRQVYSTFMPGSVPPGTSGDGIWTAWASDPVTGIKVVGMRSSTVETAVLTLAVYSFSGAAQLPGASGTHSDQTGQTPLLVDLAATRAGSIVVGGFHHGTANTLRAPNAATQWDVTDDPTTAPNGHFQAVGRLIGLTAGPGTVTIGSDQAGPYSLTSALEILPR